MRVHLRVQLVSATSRWRIAAGVTAFVHVAGAARIQVALRDEGVLVVPGELFGRSDHFRVGLAGPRAAFTFAVERVERLL